MCDYGQGGVTDVPAQLRTSVRREEAEGVTHWKSGGGGVAWSTPNPYYQGHTWVVFWSLGWEGMWFSLELFGWVTGRSCNLLMLKSAFTTLAVGCGEGESWGGERGPGKCVLSLLTGCSTGGEDCLRDPWTGAHAVTPQHNSGGLIEGRTWRLIQ